MARPRSALRKRITFTQRLSIVNAALVAVGSVLAAVAWYPEFVGKQEELSAFELLKDNPTGVLTVRDLGPAGPGTRRYDVSYTLLLKNTANVDFDMAWSLDQLFVGTMAASSPPDAPRAVNDPPDVWDASPQGMLAWRELKYDLAIEDGLQDAQIDDFFTARHKPVTAPGGGMTGLYVPGHVTGHSARYIVVARPEDFVNVTITYGMNRAPTLWQRLGGHRASPLYDDVNLANETVRLADADQPGCALGVDVQNGQIKSACTANPF